MNWYVRSVEDNTYYGGLQDGAHAWSVSTSHAKAYPTYMQAYLAKLKMDRSYSDVGYYTTDVVSETDAS